MFQHNKERLNNKPLSNSEFDRLLISLGGKGVFNSAYNLRQLQTIFRDNGDVVYIELINQKDWCKNVFQVTNQVTVSANRVNRYDVTLLINGLPLVQIELKRRGMELKQAFNQINIIFPLYADAMPGITKLFFEELNIIAKQKESVKAYFIVHSGFGGAKHSRAVERYLEYLSLHLGLKYMGTAIKPNSEGL